MRIYLREKYLLTRQLTHVYPNKEFDSDDDDSLVES